MNNLIYLFIAFLLVLLNAFFVAAEFGMVKLRYTRVATIKEEHPWRGSILAKVHKQLDAYLSACQLGITLASLGLGWVGEPAVASLFLPLFSLLNLKPALIEFISFIVAFSVLSFLHIVIGELMPKSLAIRQSEQISLWTAAPIYAFYWTMYPIIWLLNSCSNLLLKQLRLDEVHPGEQSHSSDEIKLILRSSQLHGELSAEESGILARTLDLSELRVMDIMSSYSDMVYIPSQLSKEELTKALNHHYTRYPVYDSQTNQFIGLLHVKDLQLVELTIKDGLVNLQPLLRPIPKISYRLPTLSLLRQFQTGMPHFALVSGRQGNILGFVTLDNLLHLVIGVIQDEFHKTQDAWITHVDGSITIKGDASLFTLERVLKKDLQLSLEQEESATISGLILHELGRVPEEGTALEFPTFSLTIEKIEGTKIKQIRIRTKE